MADRSPLPISARERLFFEQTPIAFVEITPRMTIADWNPAAERIFGYTRAEALGRDINALIVPPDTLAAVRGVEQGLLSGTGGTRSSNDNLTKDGRRLVCEWYNTSLRDTAGQVVGIASLVHDVTAKVAAERALVESETKLRAIFENSRDAVAVSVAGVHTFVNPAYVQMFGYGGAEEIVGRPILDLIAPEAQADIRERVRMRALGTPTSNSYETRGQREDGTAFDMEVEVSIYELGGVSQTLVFMRDVTERNRVRRALESSERRFRVLLEKSHDVMSLLDAQGNVTYNSPSYERITGHDPATRTGRSMLEHVHPGDVALVREAFGRILATPRASESFQLRVLGAGGRTQWMDLSATNHLGDPAVQSVVVNYRDITERKLAEEERAKLERQMQHVQKLESLGVLAGGIAHDFNNLLMAVLGHAGLALSQLSPASPVRENLDEIEKAARRAADLTKQMLAYSGKGRFVVHSLDLREVIREMTHMLEVSISKKAVLRFQFAKSLPAVHADATQMRQIVMNLVINASEAIAERSGVIAITVGSMPCDRAYLASTFLDEQLPEGTYVFLEVADTGCGMDKETLARIFDPFFSTKFAGRGLGLAAALGIVRGHKGAIRVYSEPGKGTTFKILLPATEQPSEAPHEGVASDGWRGQGTILLVDDEEMVRAVGKKMLGLLGFSVVTAEDGREALGLYRATPERFCLVILDLTMPHLDGEETFRELRRIRADVAVVLSSGYNEQEVTQRFSGKGLAGFLQKPYNIGELERELRAVVENSP